MSCQVIDGTAREQSLFQSPYKWCSKTIGVHSLHRWLQSFLPNQENVSSPKHKNYSPTLDFKTQCITKMYNTAPKNLNAP